MTTTLQELHKQIDKKSEGTFAYRAFEECLNEYLGKLAQLPSEPATEDWIEKIWRKLFGAKDVVIWNRGNVALFEFREAIQKHLPYKSEKVVEIKRHKTIPQFHLYSCPECGVDIDSGSKYCPLCGLIKRID